MALQATQTVTYNTLFTNALRTVLKTKPVEQSYETNAMLSMLERKNDLKVDPAGYLHCPVSTVQTALGGSYVGASTLSTAGVEDVTMAAYELALYGEPVKILDEEEVKQSGPEALFDLAAHKAEQARMRLENLLANHLVNTPDSTTFPKALVGLHLAIPSDPTASVAYGNLNGATAGQTFWRNYANATAGSWAGSGAANMDTLTVNVSAGGGRSPDWYVTSSAVFNYMRKEARTYHQISTTPTSAKGKKVADLGYSVIEWEGKPVIWDRNMTSGAGLDDALFAIQNSAVKLATIPGREFSLSRFTDLQGAGQQGRIAYVRWAGQLVTYERRMLGRLDGIAA